MHVLSEAIVLSWSSTRFTPQGNACPYNSNWCFSALVICALTQVRRRLEQVAIHTHALKQVFVDGNHEHGVL
jgi:hypothetical protein